MSKLKDATHPVVVKVGGASLASQTTLVALLSALKQRLKQRPWVLVHGGGATVDEWLAQAGLQSSKHNGQRISPAEHLPLISGALAGYTNKQLVMCAQQAGICSLGMSFVDGVALPLTQHHALGCVGVPDWQQLSDHKNTYSTPLMALLMAGFTPVISTIGTLGNCQLANVNADLGAAAIAYMLDADLLLLSDVEAILDANGQAIGDISLEQGYALLEQRFVQGGMRVKLQAALEAASRCRRMTAITSWQQPAQVIALLEGYSVGTRII